MWWSPLATCGCLCSNITWAELKLHGLEFVLCSPRVRGVWFRLWGFFNQWIPITVNFASCSQLCWVWSDFGVSGISVPSSGASAFSPRGRVNHTLRCWGVFFNTNQGKITADTEIYWPVSALSTFPGASPDLPDFSPIAAALLLWKSCPRELLQAFSIPPIHILGSVVGHIETRVAPLSLSSALFLQCLRLCKVFIFLSSSFNINSCWLCLSP